MLPFLYYTKLFETVLRPIKTPGVLPDVIPETKSNH